MFDEKYKKPIPKIPSKVGIVTASTGAAIKDILSTIKRRFPLCETILFPSLVQGENAAPDIVKNIKLADTYDLDVLIVGRGGGSIEDLWPFNEEIVARAIFEANVPIISAVGHEVDFTIADFVADMRAPTPTGAAELAVPNRVEVLKHLEQLKIRASENILQKVNYFKLYIDSLKNSFVIKNPMIMYENKQQSLDMLSEKLKVVIINKLENKKYQLELFKKNYLLNNPKEIYKQHIIKLDNLIEKLNLINPLNVLKRGYSLTYIDDKVISDIQFVNKRDIITTKLQNGYFKAEVIDVKEENHGNN